ncbi:uncharacterized protein LOC114361417 [Ostrinia furnacalis]|uniref:uncharacterized protein LOC114361417 n=1 Tax=Ostrinia furnacalis TaxID=93504 RepID=UPI00103FCEF2|nr:uncharacterized protein LOC114361417 [Ostrinia furnacalis]
MWRCEVLLVLMSIQVSLCVDSPINGKNSTNSRRINCKDNIKTIKSERYKCLSNYALRRPYNIPGSGMVCNESRLIEEYFDQEVIKNISPCSKKTPISVILLRQREKIRRFIESSRDVETGQCVDIYGEHAMSSCKKSLSNPRSTRSIKTDKDCALYELLIKCVIKDLDDHCTKYNQSIVPAIIYLNENNCQPTNQDQPKVTSDSKSPKTWIIIGGIVGVLLVIILVTCLFWKYLKKVRVQDLSYNVSFYPSNENKETKS